jgi:hypothetical protein
MQKKCFFFGILAFSGLLFYACGSSHKDKPLNLIPQQKMEEILYDLAIIDGARIADPQGIIEANIEQQGFIFKKYDIDSAQFAQSNHFYSKDLDIYIAMYERVLSRIEKEKVLLDTIVKKNKQINDSIKKMELDTTTIKKVKSQQIFKKNKTKVKHIDGLDVKN